MFHTLWLLVVICTVSSLPFCTPPLAKTSKNLPHIEILGSSFPILTLSHIKVRPTHPFLPLSGPNIGCV
ncbi:unnamed protein product, partial [Vitis vinifera]|uniref:Uncharacterized protein n=1 Tax=Vitis vinifera TaxID=29760 RepID=D7TZ82_VITVI